MTASATAISTDMTHIPAYEEDTDTDGETEAARLGQNIVIKLEPESDPEDLSPSCIPMSTNPSLTNSNSREAEGCDLDGSFKQREIENGVPTTNVTFPAPIKEERDGEDCSVAVFPVRAFRNDHGSAREDRRLLQQDKFLEPTLFDDASDDGIVSSMAGRGRGGSAVSRRKLSVSRRLPVLCLTPRTKKKTKAKTENRQLGEEMLAAMGEEGQGMALETEYGSLIPPPKPDKPVVRTSKRGRKRNLKPPSLVCGLCGLTFRWPSRYQAHLRRHSGERPHVCPECGDAFTSASYLRVHARKHRGLAPYPCQVCGEAFLQAHLLTAHRRGHAQQGAFACPDCGLRCPSPSALSAHRRAAHPAHPGNRPFACRLSPAAVQRSYHLETHMRSHTGEKPFKCDLCGLAYTTQGSLKVHMRTHTGERPFACSECSRAFITSGQLKKHSRTHNRPVVTVSEDSNTVYVQKLKSVTPVRDDEKTGGEGCHLKLEIQCFPKDSTYSCDKCQEVFVRSIDLASHMRHDHPQPVQKENMCRECGQVFSRPHTLKVHLRSHAGIRPFKCETCGKQFTQRSILNAHLRSHSQAKPFQCSVCGASYSSAKYRQIHMKIHAEIRPNECIVCGSTFSSNTALTNHVRIHNHSEVVAAIAVSGAIKESFQAPWDSSASESETKGGNHELHHGNTRSERVGKEVTDGGDHAEEVQALVKSAGTGGHTPGKADQSTNHRRRPEKKRKAVKTNWDLRSINETHGVTGSDPARTGDGGAKKDRPKNAEPDDSAVGRAELPDLPEERQGAQAEEGHQGSEESWADQSDHPYSSDTETEYDP